MSDVNVVRKLAGTTFRDGINKYLSLFCVFHDLISGI
jgi:hypothetical protein